MNFTGGQFVSPIEDFPVEMYNKIIALNLSAAFHTIRLSVKGMKRKGIFYSLLMHYVMLIHTCVQVGAVLLTSHLFMALLLQ